MQFFVFHEISIKIVVHRRRHIRDTCALTLVRPRKVNNVSLMWPERGQKNVSIDHFIFDCVQKDS